MRQMRVERDFGHIWVETAHNRYAFAPLRGDKIRGGDKSDLEGKYAYVGETMMNNYISESDIEEVPEEVLDAAGEHGTIVTNVGGGWDSWDGRPEFSTSYVDVSDIEVVRG